MANAKNNIISKSIKPTSESKSVPIPERLQPILWSKNIKNLNYKKDKIYIIHQVLSYGSIEDIKLILKIYSREEIINVFVNYPRKVYTKAVFLFIKDILLKIDLELDPKKYVKNTIKPVE